MEPDEQVNVCLTTDTNPDKPSVTCIVSDVAHLGDGPHRARETLPEGLVIRDSQLPNAGLGVWAEVDFQEGTQFGPYVGEKVDKEVGCKSGYAWEIREHQGEGDILYCIDGKDKARSNWMRFVNCALRESEQNLKAYQVGESIYYVSYKPIPAGDELLTFYGEEYGRKLGVQTASKTDQETDVEKQDEDILEEDMLKEDILEDDRMQPSSNPDPETDVQKQEEDILDEDILEDEGVQPTSSPDPETNVEKQEEDILKEGILDEDILDDEEMLPTSSPVADSISPDDEDVPQAAELKVTRMPTQRAIKSTKPSKAPSAPVDKVDELVLLDDEDDDDNEREGEVDQVNDLGSDDPATNEGASLPEPVVCTWYEDVQDWAEGLIDLDDEDREMVHDRTSADAAVDDNPREEEIALLDKNEVSISSMNTLPKARKMTLSRTANIFDKFAPLLGQKRHATDADGPSNGVQSVENLTSRNLPVVPEEDMNSHVGDGYHESQLQEADILQAVEGDESERLDGDANVGGDVQFVETAPRNGEDARVQDDHNQTEDVTRKGTSRSSHEIEDGISQQAWRQFICTVCKKACHNKQALYDHQKTHTFLQCGTCLLSFLDEESLALHEQDHKERPFFCGTCGKTYKSHFSLKEHEYSHTGHRPFVCPYCPKGFMRNKKLKIHMKKAHPKLVRAAAARKPPPSPLLLTQNSSDEMPSTSKVPTTDTSQDVAPDQYDHNEMSVASYKCKTCRKTYPTKKGLEKHAKIHQIWASSVLSANSAGSSPRDSDNADNSAPDNEIVTEQSTIGPRPFKCQLCESTFLEESHLQTHVEIHSMDGPWTCTACHRQLKQRAHLLEHMYTHWGYKPYICLYCPMDFKRTYEAEKHMNLHKHQERRKKVQKDKGVSGKRTGAIYTNRGSETLDSSGILQNLLTANRVSVDPEDTIEDGAMDLDDALGEQGQSIESSEENVDVESVSPQQLVPLRCPVDGKTRPYACDLCDRAFTAKSSLREHLFLHYGKPFPCDHCERQFTRKAYLITHMREIHPDADITAVEQSGLDSKYEEVINKALEKYPYIEPKRITQMEEPKIQAPPPSDHSYICKVCGKGFQFSATLQKHMRAHVKLKPLLCDFCERRFVRQCYLDDHIRTQHPPGSRSKDPNKPFKCETCDLAFSKRSYLKDHRYRHKLKKPFPCTFCTKGFRRRCLLQMHVSRHHSAEYRKMASESSTNPVPKSQSASTGTLKVRLPFKKQKSKSSSSLQKDPLMCYECGTTFSCRANVRRHMRIHSGDRPFKCQFCPWTFNRKEVLQGHMKKKHPEKKAQDENEVVNYKVISGGHRCQKCGGVYKSPFALQVHMKQHINASSTNPINCTYCDLSFQRDVDLIKHNRFVHGINLEKHSLPPSNVKKIKEEPGKRPAQSSSSTELHVCHRCGSRFDSFWGLESHTRVHEKHSRFPRPYKCVDCGAAFKGLANHTRHMRVHTPEYIAETKKLLSQMPGKKPRIQASVPARSVAKKVPEPSQIDPERKHICPKCGTGYKYARNLQKHVSRHVKSRDRPYQCTVCGIYGKSRGSITKHMNIHSIQATSSLSSNPEESKAHICKRCGAAFNTKLLLLKHMASHVNPNPSQPVYKCKHCNADFKHRGALTIHERSHASLNFEFVREISVSAENPPTDERTSNQTEKQVFVIKELKCPVCEKTFTRRSGVSNHIKIHPEFEFVWQDDLSAKATPEDKPYQCGVCLMSFRMKSSLTNHMRSHRSEDAQESTVMNESIEDASDQQTPEARPYACNECSCTFRNIGHLKTHMRVHMHSEYEKRNHVCDVCQCRFISSTNLKKHRKIHFNQSTTSTTPNDPASVYSKLENAESIDVKTKRPFKCRMCGGTFKAKHLLDEHIQTHSISPRQSQCTAKQKETSNPDEILGSPVAHPSSGDAFNRMVQRPYECPICHDRFKLKSTRYKHIRLHRQSEGKPLRCSTCGLGFFSMGNMTKHLKRVHGKSSNSAAASPVLASPFKTPVQSPGRSPRSASKERPFACKYCGDTFTMRCNMNRHRKRHETGDNLPFRCPHCGFGFQSTKERTKHVLRAHSNQESSPSPSPSIIASTLTSSGHKCPLCGDTFKDPSGMYKHMRVHAKSANKPFKCGVCHIGYNTVVGLTRHKGRVNHVSPGDEEASKEQPRETADVKPNKEKLDAELRTKRYKCKFCPAEYRDRSSVWRHEQVHKQGPTKSRPFPCKVCGYSCYTQVYLKHHMQMHRKSLFANQPQVAVRTDMLGRKTGNDRCKRCGLCFKTKSLFLVHIKRCSVISPFSCKICSVRFSNQIMLTKHVRQNHKEVQRDVINVGGRSIIRETGHDKKFCCDQCDARYKRPSEIEKHLRRHALGLIKPQVGYSSPVINARVSDDQTMSSDEDENQPPEEQELSPEVRPTLESIRQSLSPGRTPVHNRTAKSNKARPFVCQTCGFAFMTVIHLRKHTRLHKVAHTKPFVCKICTLGYTRLLDYHRHCNVVHPWRKGSPNEIRCPRCKRKFDSKTELVEHLEKETCQFTDEMPEAATDATTDQFEDPSTMYANDESNLPDTSNRELMCPICSCQFLAKAHLETHMKVHDNWESQPFKCERCKLGYSTKQHFTKHLNLNPLCLKLSQQSDGSASTASATHNAMQGHVQVPKKTGKSLTCPHCGKGFVKKSQMNFHIELHTPSPDRPHVCKICGIGYKTMPNYVKHMKWEQSKIQSESGKLTAAIFMCRDCGYSVTNKAILLEHNQYGCPKKKSNPAVEAPKACPVCGNFFTTSMMCIHLHGHLYDKLVQCSQCPLRFSLREEREEHEKEHPNWNQMLLDLLSSEFNRKLNPDGKSIEPPVKVKIEPGLELSNSNKSRPPAMEEARKESNAVPRIKPEPVDEPEYNYDFGSLRNSALGDYHALLPDASENSIPFLPQKQTKKSNSQAASVSRLEQIVSNLAAQRPQPDAESESVASAILAPVTNNLPEQAEYDAEIGHDSVPEAEDSIPSVESISKQVLKSVPNLSPRVMSSQQSTSSGSSAKIEKHSAPKQTLYRCRYCPSAFRLKGLCRSHERTVHRKIYSRGQEQKNKPVKDLGKMFVCEICNAVFEQRSSLSRHMLFKHGKPLKAAEESDDLGSTTSDATSSRRAPPSNASSNGPFITNVTSHGMSESSGNSTGHMSILQQRLQAPSTIDDQDELGMYQPSLPNQDVSKLEALLTTGSLNPIGDAESSLLDIRPYKCKGCNFAFTQRHHLVRHIKRQSCAFHVLGRKAAAQLKDNHKGDEGHNGSAPAAAAVKIKVPEKKHKCPICPRAFWKRCRLENHMKVHDGVGFFQCRYCSKEFQYKEECATHEDICPSGPSELNLDDFEGDQDLDLDQGEEMDFEEDEELDQAQEEAFMDEPDENVGYMFGAEAEEAENLVPSSNGDDINMNWADIRIKEEPLD